MLNVCLEIVNFITSGRPSDWRFSAYDEYTAKWERALWSWHGANGKLQTISLRVK